ncbi:MAG: EamA family transporter [Nitrospinota bacterium]
MEPLALFLVVASGFIHAGWNFWVKGSGDPLAALWSALAAALVLYLPLFIVRFPGMDSLQAGAPFILATGVIHTFYFFTLTRAYETGDLSTVYPLARGSAPLLTAVLAGIFLGERISPAGGAGILLIVSGIAAVHAFHAGAGPRAAAQEGRREAIRWALATGLSTSVYSVVDKAGVARVAPEAYIYFMFLLSALFLAPWVLTGERGKSVRALAREPGAWLRIAGGGLCTMGSYLLILFAMRMSKVSYVVAAREVSVVLGAALGVFVLKEGEGGRKLAGAGLVAAGLALLALAK